MRCTLLTSGITQCHLMKVNSALAVDCRCSLITSLSQSIQVTLTSPAWCTNTCEIIHMVNAHRSILTRVWRTLVKIRLAKVIDVAILARAGYIPYSRDVVQAGGVILARIRLTVHWDNNRTKWQLKFNFRPSSPLNEGQFISLPVRSFISWLCLEYKLKARLLFSFILNRASERFRQKQGFCFPVPVHSRVTRGLDKMLVANNTYSIFSFFAMCPRISLAQVNVLLNFLFVGKFFVAQCMQLLQDRDQFRSVLI